MKILYFWLNLLMPCFAAGPSVLGSAGGGGDAEVADVGADTGDSSSAVGDAAEDVSTDEYHEEQGHAKSEDRQEYKEEPEVQEFKGSVSARLRNLAKQAPELGQIFQKYPKIQEQIEATFRREAALREVWPTVAEARQMRETFPNGLADVQQLHSELKEVEELDTNFANRDQDGNYPGHAKIIDNMFSDNREAAISLFRNMPKEWARLDRDSYNDVMGKVVGATISNARVFEDLADSLHSGDQKRLEADVTKLFNWANGFLQDKPKPSEEQQALARERATFNKERDQRSQEEGNRFHSSFVTQAKKLQADIIRSHPAMKRFLDSKTVPDQKKGEILEQVRSAIEQKLSKSTSFMGKLKPAYEARNMEEITKLQRVAWSQQWLLNSQIRAVLNKETPQIVTNNREAVRRRAGAPQAKDHATGERKAATGPVQVGGRWFRDGGKGQPFTTTEVLLGKHLS